MNKQFLEPLAPLSNPLGHARMVLSSVGLQYVKPRFFKVDTDSVNAEDAAGLGLNAPDKQSWMGTPVFDTLRFDDISYYDIEKNANISTAGMTLENVLFVVTPTKNVVRTSIPGGNGTVKEYIGMGDYDINITIQLVGRHANVPPEQELRQLLEFIKAPISLPVYNNILSYFEIFSIVVIDQPSITQVSGARNVFNVSIPCVSDKPFEVEYNSNKKQVSNSGSVPSITF